MSRPVAAIFCGSRDWGKESAIRDVINSLPSGSVVIHGDCRGADRIADDEADAAGVTVVSMPAQWSRDGKGAGPIRNECMAAVQRMLGTCGYDIVVHAFPLPNSRGTRNMMAIAHRCGVEVINHGSGS